MQCMTPKWNILAKRNNQAWSQSSMTLYSSMGCSYPPCQNKFLGKDSATIKDAFCQTLETSVSSINWVSILSLRLQLCPMTHLCHHLEFMQHFHLSEQLPTWHLPFQWTTDCSSLENLLHALRIKKNSPEYRQKEKCITSATTNPDRWIASTWCRISAYVGLKKKIWVQIWGLGGRSRILVSPAMKYIHTGG